MSEERRLIEDYIPIQAISAEASHEKSVRKGRSPRPNRGSKQKSKRTRDCQHHQARPGLTKNRVLLCAKKQWKFMSKDGLMPVG